MELVGLMAGDDGWTSCMDWGELSVAVVSMRLTSASALSAMASSASRRKLNAPHFLSLSLSLSLLQSVFGRNTVRKVEGGGKSGWRELN